MTGTARGTVVVVGGGLAGASAAFALRDGGHDGQVVLIGDEPVAPYERPPLSKGYLQGADPFESALVRPPADYETSGIDLRLGRRAVTLDPATRRLNLDDGETLSYDALILATGSKARRLDIPGADLPGLLYLRSVADADALRSAALAADRIVVIGGGWIGSEVAASLRQLDRGVTIISDTERPLERVLGPEVADVYLHLHLDHGVRIVRGMATRLEGAGRVERVVLEDGTGIEAGLVVAGIGAIPRIKLAQRAGLTMAEGGVAVDEYLRTSVPSIHAAGDIAAAWHPRYGRHIRIEHWDNAKRQGAAAAANILGAEKPYTRTPYFYSDQYDLGMEYRGFAPQWGQVVTRGDLAAREFDAFWLADGRVLAAMNANRWDDGKALSRLVASEARVDPARLADPTVPLDELVAASTV